LDAKDNIDARFNHMLSVILDLNNKNTDMQNQILTMHSQILSLQTQIASQNTFINAQNRQLVDQEKKLSEINEKLDKNCNDIDDLFNRLDYSESDNEENADCKNIQDVTDALHDVQDKAAQAIFRAVNTNTPEADREKEKAIAEVARLKAEAEAKTQAEIDRLKAEADAKTQAEIDRLKAETEAKTQAEINRLKAIAEAEVASATAKLKQITDEAAAKLKEISDAEDAAKLQSIESKEIQDAISSVDALKVSEEKVEEERAIELVRKTENGERLEYSKVVQLPGVSPPSTPKRLSTPMIIYSDECTGPEIFKDIKEKEKKKEIDDDLKTTAKFALYKLGNRDASNKYIITYNNEDTTSNVDISYLLYNDNYLLEPSVGEIIVSDLLPQDPKESGIIIREIKQALHSNKNLYNQLYFDSDNDYKDIFVTYYDKIYKIHTGNDFFTKYNDKQSGWS
jgi:hypothetical protein